MCSPTSMKNIKLFFRVLIEKTTTLELRNKRGGDKNLSKTNDRGPNELAPGVIIFVKKHPFGT